jgi:hypothetical protein
LLQNPQCCFVYYLVFKDQAALCDRLRTLPEQVHPVKKKFPEKEAAIFVQEPRARDYQPTTAAP